MAGSDRLRAGRPRAAAALPLHPFGILHGPFPRRKILSFRQAREDPDGGRSIPVGLLPDGRRRRREVHYYLPGGGRARCSHERTPVGGPRTKSRRRTGRGDRLDAPPRKSNNCRIRFGRGRGGLRRLAPVRKKKAGRGARDRNQRGRLRCRRLRAAVRGGASRGDACAPDAPRPVLWTGDRRPRVRREAVRGRAGRVVRGAVPEHGRSGTLHERRAWALRRV
mmetsp:Transcript_49848/g.97537  ORF Transcript_49848/g.97537 Transcript_49848/m.97537 type:complete len:222 (+) Transcript_49848:153-818(+)